ncbi:MAG: serine hydrolase [Patulibacter sp.]|nr:serine hydrolase [Patulibacter sp.]
MRVASRLLIAAVVAALPTPGALAAPAAAQQPGNPATVSAVPVPPERIAAAIAQLDVLAPTLLARSGVPGMAVAVVHRDRVVYAKGFGVRSTRTGTPVDPATVFPLASVSKPVGATVIARAVTQRRVAWDDRVQPLLPWFRLRDPYVTRNVTIADLYGHRSGLPAHAGDLLEDLGYDREQVLRRLRLMPLAPFRTEHRYTNFGLTAAAEAVATKLDTSWEALSERTLYRPLGMTSTSSRFRDYRRRANRAELHMPTAKGWQPLQRRDADEQSPAGGVSSNVSDMAQWMRLQLGDGVYAGKRLVSADALAEMRAPHSMSGVPSSPDARPSFYGLGIGVGVDSTARVRFSHSGGFLLGAGTNVQLLPSEDLGIVVLTNGQPRGLAEALTESFLEMAELGTISRDWLAAYGGAMAPIFANPSVLSGRTRPASPAAPKRLAAYAGSYRSAYYGTATVRASGKDLILRLGPDRMRFRLNHWSGNRWTYHPPGENGTGISLLTFRFGRGSDARSMTIEHLDEDGLGTFRR